MVASAGPYTLGLYYIAAYIIVSEIARVKRLSEAEISKNTCLHHPSQHSLSSSAYGVSWDCMKHSLLFLRQQVAWKFHL